MKLITYQSEIVLKILLQNKIYKAKPSISFKKEYAALIDMLKLDCECPVFAVVEGRKQNTSGRVSSSVKLFLDVPDDKIKYTEFSTWADLMYTLKFSKPYNYRQLMYHNEDFDSQNHKRLINEIENHKSYEEYKFPQAILEYIDPSWLVKYKKERRSERQINFLEKLGNLFRFK